MKTTHLYILLAIIVIVGISCRNKQPQNTATQELNENVEVVENNEEIEIEEDYGIETSFSVNDKIQQIKPPFRDSTNFDNYAQRCVELLDSEIEKMDLLNLISDGSNFMGNYIMDWPYDFFTIAVTYGKGEMEQLTTLITYTKGYKFIDMLDVAYDEVAESWFRKESDIYKDHIIVEDISYVNDEPEITRTRYNINPDGTFSKISE